ncbi:hypothetical protein [Alteromonas sp. KUL49]|uniref:hypothetical protein n=1 Tax=Alteromonas sp. KUL49 TaxID=2480798 RepID=UPI00102F014A|nr:hypothetical protein [Alteromonas sp. KUL49]TAP40325.1 hypothetical protein EYS00_09185 [Alteromonas sp. KUL49]GEA11470.1 hypothetical protein KUL49_18450 [Alteromonas sp. KUL49]
MKKFLITFFGAVMCMSANAAVITSDFTELTTTGQTYSETVSLNDTYSSVYVDLIIKGDFDNVNVEWFRLFADGNLLAEWNTSTAGLTVVTNSATRDYTLSGTFAIAQSLWDSIAADGLLDVSWAIGPFSDPTPTQFGSDFVDYSFNATPSFVQVGAPASLLLIACALFGITSLRRRFK